MYLWNKDKILFYILLFNTLLWLRNTAEGINELDKNSICYIIYYVSIHHCLLLILKIHITSSFQEIVCVCQYCSELCMVWSQSEDESRPMWWIQDPWGSIQRLFNKCNTHQLMLGALCNRKKLYFSIKIILYFTSHRLFPDSPNFTHSWGAQLY